MPDTPNSFYNCVRSTGSRCQEHYRKATSRMATLESMAHTLEAVNERLETLEVRL